jgi:hypothetical protein
MTAPTIRKNTVIVNGRSIDIGLSVLDAQASGRIVLVLVDPDSYLMDPDYRKRRRSGLAAIRNLRAFSANGTRLWEAELPEEADYYYRIVGVDPIEADSFSGFRCRIDSKTGGIVCSQFMK